jgi:outer membrane receptor protein involved in Fe transport
LALLNFSDRIGVYANYSEGFVPPQVTEMYTGVKVPNLSPSVFYNYEAGGWAAIIKNKLSADFSVYKLNGTNEIISVKLDDGSYANQNAGKTLHRGIEFGLNATPVKIISFRFSGTYSKHEFVEYTEKGTSYNGFEMNNAPHWIYNTELWYKPLFVRGLRIGAEWQHIGRYFADPRNTASYAGYDVLNLRTGYQFKGMELWLNVLNATGKYYSYITTKSAFGYSYQLGEPRNIDLGISYDLATLLKKK